jgi:hypothetical protein
VDVLRAARAYLDPGELSTVMVCDPVAVKPQLEGVPLGDIEVRPAGGGPEARADPAGAGPGSRESVVLLGP